MRSRSGRQRIFMIFAVLLLVFFPGNGWCKYADLAGSWYTSSSSALRAELERYLNDAKAEKIKGKVIGFISPHAGFRFSGPVAAYTYKAAALSAPETVIVVGFSHRMLFPDIAVFTEEAFINPLGPAYIDKEISRELIAYDNRLREFPGAFGSEQSVEMQIPFIQVAMKEAKLVLISIGDQTYENVQLLADALHSVLKDRKSYVIIGSTDMSHYLPYGAANEKDSQTMEIIKSFEPKTLYSESLLSGHGLMCGYGAGSAVMLACKKLGADEVKILKYANSGDVSGMKDRVVGYLSAAFVKSEEKGDKMLTKDQKETLLKLARDTTDHYLRTGKRLEVKIEDELLKRDMGAFVTLHKNGQLRGCIGHMEATGPLYLTVRDMAIAAAVQDPRFPPVTVEEMDKIDIEISVLTPMEKIEDPGIIEMGKHGVMVQSGLRSGVYLPQVAVETGWDREQFMDSLCAHKAGLPADAWRTGACDIYVFTAEVFGEEEHE